MWIFKCGLYKVIYIWYIYVVKLLIMLENRECEWNWLLMVYRIVVCFRCLCSVIVSFILFVIINLFFVIYFLFLIRILYGLEVIVSIKLFFEKERKRYFIKYEIIIGKKWYKIDL